MIYTKQFGIYSFQIDDWTLDISLLINFAIMKSLKRQFQNERSEPNIYYSVRKQFSTKVSYDVNGLFSHTKLTIVMDHLWRKCYCYK
jgi:hypothetical protein